MALELYSTRSILYQIRDFIRILTFDPNDGKFLLTEKGTLLKYICLNPALTLKRIIDRSDKVLLASGTLEPSEEYDVLKKYFYSNNFLEKFSCPHILPPTSFKALAISKFEGRVCDFKFNNRESD